MPLRALLAIVLSLLFLVGRWNLQRLGVDPDTIDYDQILQRSVAAVLTEPRLWLVVASVLLMVLMETGTSGEAHAHSGRRKAPVSVSFWYLAITW
jgi:hypothetical protein